MKYKLSQTITRFIASKSVSQHILMDEYDVHGKKVIPHCITGSGKRAHFAQPMHAELQGSEVATHLCLKPYLQMML